MERENDVSNIAIRMSESLAQIAPLYSKNLEKPGSSTKNGHLLVKSSCMDFAHKYIETTSYL